MITVIPANCGIRRIFRFYQTERLIIFRLETDEKYPAPLGIGGNSLIFERGRVVFDLPWASGAPLWTTGRHYLDVVFMARSVEEDYDARGELLWSCPFGNARDDGDNGLTSNSGCDGIPERESGPVRL